MKKVLLEILQNSPGNTFFIEHLVAASVFFQSILLVLTKFSFWQENWGTNLSFYDSSRVPVFKTTLWLQVQST